VAGGAATDIEHSIEIVDGGAMIVW
jgi:hypothetical protein